MAELHLDDVRYHYSSKYMATYAVRGISYTFVPGRFYAVMGPSGSGKTTLLALIAGLDAPTSGRVLFDGTDISTLNRDRYRLNNVSVIYQSYNLFPMLTAIENVMLPMQLNRKGKQAAAAAQKTLAEVGLGKEYYARYPSMLSGGEQQRIAIARALASGTPVILADEPTGALDSENRGKVMALLSALAHSSDRCVIAVTHDPAVAEQADVVLTMRDGRILSISENR